jgi:hypothetical protein
MIILITEERNLQHESYLENVLEKSGNNFLKDSNRCWWSTEVSFQSAYKCKTWSNCWNIYWSDFGGRLETTLQRYLSMKKKEPIRNNTCVNKRHAINMVDTEDALWRSETENLRGYMELIWTYCDTQMKSEKIKHSVI